MLATRTVHVLFDTNPIFVQSDSDLLSADVVAYIEARVGDPDFDFTWVLPEAVVEERRFRMTQKAVSRLGDVRRAERVVGRSFGLTEANLGEGVQARIAESCAKHSVLLHRLDYSAVDWPRVVAHALGRTAPFEDGEDGKKEKGFRDAVIGETMLQYITTVEDNLTKQLAIMVTDDGRLTEMLETRTAGRTNVQFARSVDALKGLVEEARAGISAQVAEKIREQASLYFSGTPDSLWSQASVFTATTEVAFTLLGERPAGADRTELVGIVVRPARFVDRVGREVTWESVIAIDVRAWRKQVDYVGALLGSNLLNLLRGQAGPQPHDPTHLTGQWASVLGQLPHQSQEVTAAPLPDLLIGKRTVVVAVRWKASLEDDVLQGGGEIVSVTPSAEEWELTRP